MENFGVIIIVIIISFVVFLLLRELNCWYWKINKKISLMEETNQLLKSLVLQKNTALPTEPKNNVQNIEDKSLKLYDTNQGEIYINQNEDKIEIGDLVFTYFKKPHFDARLTIKNGPKIEIQGGKIIEIKQ